MTPAIDRAALDRLIALGKGTGRVSMHELRTHLPVSSLTAEDIALVVLELEDAGVEVELDARCSQRRDSGRPLIRPRPRLSFPISPRSSVGTSRQRACRAPLRAGSGSR